MNNEPQIVPRIVINSIATGLLMMAIFTTMWAGIAFGSLNHGANLLIGFGILIITFISFAIYLFSVAKRFPKLESEADKTEGKRAGKWFGIIFGAEGLCIFVAINIVINLGHADLTIPVIALVVGLHFYPMAKIFKRTIDYYLATWTTLIAVIAIVLILKKVYIPASVDAFVGIGTAIATSCYGLYMIYTGRRFVKQADV